MNATSQTTTTPNPPRHRRYRRPAVRVKIVPDFLKIPFVDLLSLIVVCFVTSEMLHFINAINHYVVRDFYFFTYALFMLGISYMIKTIICQAIKR